MLQGARLRRQWSPVVALVALALATLLGRLGVRAERSGGCPHHCSGHGTCGANHMCTCYRRWQGSDCSQRTCRFGYSFATTPQGDLNFDGDTSDYTDAGASEFTSSNILPVPWSRVGTWEGWPYDGSNAAALKWRSLETSGHTGFMLEHVDDDEMHHLTECSNAGICDRATGHCRCFAGHEGVACSRASCPNHCSGHGVCETLQRLGALSSAVPTATRSRLSTMLTACDCDPGYTGADCGRRTCPRGDDPLTVHQQNEVQEIHLDDSAAPVAGAFFLVYTDPEGRRWETVDIPALHQESLYAAAAPGTTVITLTAAGSTNSPDTSVVASADVRCGSDDVTPGAAAGSHASSPTQACFAVGDLIKIGLEVLPITSIDSTAGTAITVAMGFTTSASAGFKFYARESTIEVALESLPESALPNVTVTRSAVTTYGVKYDVSFSTVPGDLPLLAVGTSETTTLDDEVLRSNTTLRLTNTAGVRTATTATVAEKTRYTITATATVAHASRNLVTFSAATALTSAFKGDALVLGSVDETLSQLGFAGTPIMPRRQVAVELSVSGGTMSNTAEIQTVTISANPSGLTGSFTLTLDLSACTMCHPASRRVSATTASINPHVQDDVYDKLNALSNVMQPHFATTAPIQVTRTTLDSNAGYTWSVTFSGTHVLSNIPQMTASAGSLSTGAAPAVATHTEGNHPGFKLTYDSVASGCIAWDAPASARDAMGVEGTAVMTYGRSMEEILEAHAKMTGVSAAMKTGGYGYIFTFEDPSYNAGDVRRTHAFDKSVTATVAATASCDPFNGGDPTFSVAVADAGLSHNLTRIDFSAELTTEDPMRVGDTLKCSTSYATAGPEDATLTVTRVINSTRIAIDPPLGAYQKGGFTVKRVIPEQVAVVSQVISTTQVAVHQTLRKVTTAAVTNVHKGTTESVPCSNRGICDDRVGACACFYGYGGGSCTIQCTPDDKGFCKYNSDVLQVN